MGTVFWSWLSPSRPPPHWPRRSEVWKVREAFLIVREKTFSPQFTDKKTGTQGVNKAAKGPGRWEQAGSSPGLLTADTGLWKEELDGLMLGKGKPLQQL